MEAHSDGRLERGFLILLSLFLLSLFDAPSAHALHKRIRSL